MSVKWKTNEADRLHIAFIISILLHLGVLYGLYYFDQAPSTDHSDIEQIEARIENTLTRS